MPKRQAPNLLDSRLILAHEMTEKVNFETQGLEDGNAPLLEAVTPITRELLVHWFSRDSEEMRGLNFHHGQKQAILNTIYAHEIIRPKKLSDLYQEITPNALADPSSYERITHSRNNWPKYCVKMATGCGKTWVMQALMIWQYLNAREAPEDQRFTRNFLIIAPGLIVYDRLLNGISGPKDEHRKRQFEESDLVKTGDLFVPKLYQDDVRAFFQNAVCEKEDILDKAGGAGMIGIINWQALAADLVGEDEDEADEDLTPAQAVNQAFPILPGKTVGHDLTALDKAAERGRFIENLNRLSDLMVFNDEAHHIHEIRKNGQAGEVIWQRLLHEIGEKKGSRFVQVDFSATPYYDGGGSQGKRYFEHITSDFDLKDAIRGGLVKNLVMDRRSGEVMQNLDFSAERDGARNVTGLSEGQELMLRAGWKSLQRRMEGFQERNLPDIEMRTPKLFVLCEDTAVAPFVNEFLQKSMGLNEEEILEIHTSKQGMVKPDEWEKIREKVFALDTKPDIKAVISVLMLREGFDVSTICVIVPLRKTGSNVLLEQTIGRGLRLMWRQKGHSFDEIRKENLQKLQSGQKIDNYIDVLSIVEHPAFEEFYQELMDEGLVTTLDNDAPDRTPAGDIIEVCLRENYEEFDFAIPIILADTEEETILKDMDVASILPFTGFTLEQLRAQAGKGENFVHEDARTHTTYEAYRIEAGAMFARGYQDYLTKIAESIASPNIDVETGRVARSRQPFRILPESRQAELAKWIDTYIRSHLFEQSFDPTQDEGWKVLLLNHINNHVREKFARKINDLLQESAVVSEARVAHNHLSKVSKIYVREKYALEVNKCIYPILAYPAVSGGLEKSFIEVASRDGSVDAFCKIDIHQHSFCHFTYLKETGAYGSYYPDFLVRCGSDIYFVETKAQTNISNETVQRKKIAALAQCARINDLPEDKRSSCTWHYALLGEQVFRQSVGNRVPLNSILQSASVRKDAPKNEQGAFEI